MCVCGGGRRLLVGLAGKDEAGAAQHGHGGGGGAGDDATHHVPLAPARAGRALLEGTLLAEPPHGLVGEARIHLQAAQLVDRHRGHWVRRVVGGS